MYSALGWLDRSAWGLSCLVLYVASSATAQAPEPAGEVPPAADSAPNSEDAEARALFQAGIVALDDGRLESSLDYFRKAYELSDRPPLLYNIATVADRLRRDTEALQAFELYLQRVPDSAQRAAVEARIKVLRKALADGPAPAAADEPTQPKLQSDPTVAERTAPTGPGIAPWLVVAASGVVAATGGVLLVLALDDVATVEDAPDGTRWSELEDAHDRAPLLSGIGLTMIGVGVAGVLTGVLWAGTSEDSASVALTPGGLLLRGKL